MNAVDNGNDKALKDSSVKPLGSLPANFLLINFAAEQLRTATLRSQVFVHMHLRIAKLMSYSCCWTLVTMLDGTEHIFFQSSDACNLRFNEKKFKHGKCCLQVQHCNAWNNES